MKEKDYKTWWSPGCYKSVPLLTELPHVSHVSMAKGQIFFPLMSDALHTQQGNDAVSKTWPPGSGGVLSKGWRKGSIPALELPPREEAVPETGS